VGTGDSVCGVFELLTTETISVTRPGDPPPGVSASPALTETPQPQNIGVIAGATVAALIALSTLVGLFFWYRRRQRLRSKALEPLPLTTTNLLATAPPRPPETRTRTAAPLERTTPTPSYTVSTEAPTKAEYRGNTVLSTLSGSGSSGLMSSSTGARNIPPTIHSSRSHLTTPTTTIMSHSPPHSPHPLLPPPSYAAAAGDLQVHEEHPDSE
jgi:hypothetical protein